MCGPEALLAAQIFGAATSGVGAIKSLVGGDGGGKADSGPDPQKVADQAAQDAAKAKLEQRRRIRANSLLSQYSGEDQAQLQAGKATLGGA